MNLAVHLEDAYLLEEIMPFDQMPPHLDESWTVDKTREFLQAARQFVQDTQFEKFIKEHEPLYRDD